MATKLEVVSTVPTQFHDQHPETQTNNTIVIDLFTNRPLFEARGLLFSRFTRVWEGREVIGADWENGALRVVKQNWADAERVNEAFLYEKTKEVPNVARLVGSEAGSCTIGTSTWRDSDIVGVYRKGQPNAESLPYLDLAIDEEPFTLYKWDVRPQTFSRVLVRMVFEEKGRSNLEVRDSRELLEATKQWLTGLWGLKEKGILHRDVSSGNLLLGHDAYSPAFIIDLGLAHWDGDCQDNSSDHRSGDKRVAKAHHHLTGTLPFISYELLEARILDQTLKHEVRHDIESVFWVLLYLILREERSKHAKTALSALLSTDFKVVRGEKSVFLGRALNPDYALGLKLEGRFKDLARFVYRFASLFSPSETNTIKLEDIFSMIDTEILSLPQGSGKKVEPEVILPSVGSGRSKRKYDPAKDLAGQWTSLNVSRSESNHPSRAASLSSNSLVNSPVKIFLFPDTHGYVLKRTPIYRKHSASLPTAAKETVPAVDGQILSELHGNVILVKPEAFIQNFMYEREEAPISGVSGMTAPLSGYERRARDEKLAEDCLAALKGRNKSEAFNNVVQNLAQDECQNPQDVVKGISSYASNKFTNFVKGIKTEKDLYHPLAALFAFISHFYRCYFNESSEKEAWSVEVDKSWPPAVDPRRHQLETRVHLRRGYLVSHNKPFRFSPHVKGPPDLQPDIVLVLFKKRHRTKLLSPPEPHWKDVKVPIEVKLRDGFDANRVCRMARYVRAIKLEQFDRNFIFSVLISKTKCRVFQWNASQCYVTEIDMHKQPAMFI
ncbi:hypothetical protein FRC00_008252 [Tulasnella sp. 408]|nr:hypothetical protein FRC00_008252 [Tulasnella sp. 408]